MTSLPFAARCLRTVLRSVLPSLHLGLGRLRRGHTDADTVHQLRTDLRRLRTALRELKALSPAVRPEWDVALADAARRLGHWRDQHSGAQAVAPLLHGTRAPSVAWTLPSAPPAGLRAIARYGGLLAALRQAQALAERSPPGSFVPWGGRHTQAHVRRRLARLQRQLARAAPRFHRLPLAEQHRVRKRLKRLRHLGEFAHALWPQVFTRRRLASTRLARAQDALGWHHDVALACDRFRQEAATDPRAWFAAGYLQASLGATGRAAEKALQRLCRAWVRVGVRGG